MSMPPPPDFHDSVQPLPYAQAIPKRPGLLTAVGIVSIVLGSLSMFSCLGGVVSAVMFSKMQNLFPATPVMTLVAPVTQPGPATQPAAPAPAPPLVCVLASKRAKVFLTSLSQSADSQATNLAS